jgi:hypothetical protein
VNCRLDKFLNHDFPDVIGLFAVAFGKVRKVEKMVTQISLNLA